MLLGFDHLVFLVQDLDQASRDFARLGFSVEPGGRHGSGTHNALIALDDGSYLELIAFHEHNEAHRWWKWKLAGGGFIDYCMRSDDLDEDLRHLAATGVAYGAPYKLTRRRPDGYELAWEIAVPQEPRRCGAPFLIRDFTPREERVPAFRGHANGVRRIRRMVHAVQDLALVQAWAGKLAGAQSEAIERADLQARGLRVTVAAGQPSASTVDFLLPASDASPLAQLAGDRALTPYAVEFTGSDASATFAAELTHGVRLSLAA